MYFNQPRSISDDIFQLVNSIHIQLAKPLSRRLFRQELRLWIKGKGSVTHLNNAIKEGLG